MKNKIDFFLKNEKERNKVIENSFRTIQKYDFGNHLKLTLEESLKNLWE